MSRLRLAAGVGLFALAGWYAGRGRQARELPRLRVDELCSCGHLGAHHDPDLGCTVDGPGDYWCSCRRLRCRCPLSPGASR